MTHLVSRKVKSVSGRQIFDSRGIPTVEAKVVLEDGSIGIASVPSGASTGKFEAHEKRDGDEGFGGKSVYAACNAVGSELKEAIVGADPTDIFEIDRKLIEKDGSENKKRLGANAILAVSLASARAAALSYNIGLFRFLGGINARMMPVPLMNILNGGAHASNNLDVQEFMIMPTGAHSMAQAMKMGTETYFALKKILQGKGLSVSVGDEGGFAPNLKSNEEALGLITDAIEAAGYVPGKDIYLALDVAASEWKDGNDYHLPKKDTVMTSEELLKYYEKLLSQYPILSIEDPFDEEDWDSFRTFTERKGDIQIVGDDLFVTNVSRIQKGISLSAANAVLIKPNQIGSLSETINAVCTAQQGRYNAIISHRSGETTDSFIADLAVALNAGQIKTGAPCRGERLAKYNRLLEIENILGNTATYGMFK
ncbi:MAG: phosphopyruvate hydratase [Clostridia bacterium]|nr:phosphopyruvate hydratase [Clostridia bacterium]